ncbi:MAG: YgiT-type zinc finger protein [Methanosarcinales archaeon]
MIISKCIICGGNVIQKEVEEEVRIGNNFIIIENVEAGVCAECGERYYPPGVVDKIREIEKSLVNKEKIKKLDIIGNTYKLKV